MLAWLCDAIDRPLRGWSFRVGGGLRPSHKSVRTSNCRPRRRRRLLRPGGHLLADGLLRGAVVQHGVRRRLLVLGTQLGLVQNHRSLGGGVVAANRGLLGEQLRASAYLFGAGAGGDGRVWLDVGRSLVGRHTESHAYPVDSAGWWPERGPDAVISW